MNIKAFFPNLLTSANLFTGLAGIVMAFTGDYTNSIFFIILAAFFDFLDGFVARLLKVSGDFGKELDSLADVISFGALPSVYMYLFLENQYQNQYIPFLGLMIGVFSALRLAKFNLDDQQSDKFIGLPTPANAIFICTLGQLPESILQLSNIGILFTFLSCYLLVSQHELIALKFKGISFIQNIDKYILLIELIVIIAVFQLKSLPLLIPVYILTSLVFNLLNRVKKIES